jgi:putative FmdB family regulatory protein
MPIYEYLCKPCDSRFELLVSISRANEVCCPKCGSLEVKRLMSTFASRSVGSDGSSHSHGGGCAGCASGNCGSCGCH